MNTNINFILPKDKEFEERQRRKRVINTIALIFPIMVGVVSLATFLITQAINTAGIRKQQGEVISKISQLQDKKIKLFIVKDRLDGIDDLLKKRISFSENIRSLLSKIPSEVIVENLEIDSKEVILIVSSTSLKSIDEFVNSLANMAEKKEVVSSLSLDSLVFEEKDNNYLVALRSEL